MGRRRDTAEAQEAKGHPNRRRSANLKRRPPAPPAPAMPEGVPPPPAWLAAHPLALAMWVEAWPILARFGLASSGDLFGFARYCLDFAMWRRASEVLERDGTSYVITSNHGTRRAHLPEWHEERSRKASLADFEERSGLTARSRLTLLARIGGAQQPDLFGAAAAAAPHAPKPPAAPLPPDDPGDAPPPAAPPPTGGLEPPTRH